MGLDPNRRAASGVGGRAGCAAARTTRRGAAAAVEGVCVGEGEKYPPGPKGCPTRGYLWREAHAAQDEDGLYQRRNHRFCQHLGRGGRVPDGRILA